MFPAIVTGASVAGRAAELTRLAMALLYARMGQSIAHLVSTSAPAILVRFGFYLAQVGILLKWSLGLLLDV